MAEKDSEVQQPATQAATPYRRKPYSESYRNLYALRQDVINKSRQLEQSLDTIVLYVRDLLR